MDDTGTLRDMVRALKPGDTVSGGFAHRHFPEHTVLEAISDRTACVAYRVTTDAWSVTGHGYVVTSMELTRFAKNWRVVRVGDAAEVKEATPRTTQLHPEYIEPGTRATLNFAQDDLPGRSVTVTESKLHDPNEPDAVMMHKVVYETWVMHSALMGIVLPDGTWERLDR